MLVDGKWTAEWHPVQANDEKGGFVRQTSSFRNWVTPDGSAGPTGEGGFAAEAGRYHLYVALICPWASRTLIGRKLKKLDDAISMSVVEPALTDLGWRFGDYPGSDHDTLNGATYLHKIYTRADPSLTGRATVPVLWDKRRGTIVSNESADPTGFATTQVAYEEAFAHVFAMLDELERLADGRDFLFGDALTKADIRLFVTLVRVDPAYHGLLRANLRRLADYPRLSG